MTTATRAARHALPRATAWLALWALAALAVPSARAAVPAFVERTAWTEARSPHFTVFGNAGQGVSNDVARRLERAAQVMARANPGFRSTEPTAVRVLVLADVEQVRAYAAAAQMENANGFSGQGPDGGWIVLAATVPGPGSRTEVLVHEYVHGVLRANLATLPAWLNEGFAQYTSTVRIQNTWAELGRTDPDFLLFCRRQQAMPLETLFGITPGARAYQRDNPLQAAFYTQSWLLTHYLLSATGGRRERFAAWLERLREGAPARASFLEVFGEQDYAQLHAESRAYLDQIAFEKPRHVEFAERLEDTPVSERALGGAEVLARLGTLALALGRDPGAWAREHFERALALDSTRALARAGLGFVRDLEGDAAGADAAYARAAADAPDEPATALWAGLGLLRRVTRSEAPASEAVPTLHAARRHFARALQRAPQDAEALAGYGRTFVLDPQVDSTAIRALEQALALQPGRTDVAADLAGLRARAGDRAGAERLIDRVAPALPPQSARQASGTSDAALLRLAETALEGRRLAEAESLYREVATWSRDPSLREDARARAARVREARLGTAFSDLHQRGLEAAQGERFADALRLLEQARDTVESRELRIEAGRSIVQVRARQSVARAREAMAARKVTAAAAALDEALALPLSDEDRVQVQGFRDEIEAMLRIERAQGLVKAGKLREARALYREVAAMGVREEVREHARQRVADLDRALGGVR